MTVGDKLEEKLAAASEDSSEGWSLSRLHEETGISLGYLYRVRDGDQIPSREKVEAIAGALDVDADELDELIIERDIDELERYLDRLGLDRARELAQLCIVLRDQDPSTENAVRGKVREALDLANGNGS